MPGTPFGLDYGRLKCSIGSKDKLNLNKVFLKPEAARRKIEGQSLGYKVARFFDLLEW